MPRRREFSEDQEILIINRFKDGERVADIAATLNSSTSTIRRIVNRDGVQIDRVSAVRLSAEQEFSMLEAYIEGATMEVAGNMCSVDRSYIFRLLKKYHLPAIGSRVDPDFVSDVLTPEQVQTGIDRYLGGETTKQVAAAMGIVEATLRAAIKRRGVTRAHLGHGPERKLSFDQEHAIVESYYDGLSIADLTRKFGVPTTSLLRTLERNGIERDPRRRLTDDEKLFVVDSHESGKTYPQIAALLEISVGTVFRTMQDMGASPGRTGRPRSCEIDESAFDEITPVSARWMGFLFADGCLPRDTEGQQAISVHISARDHNHLLKFRNFLKSTHAVAITYRGEAFIAGSKKPTPPGRFAHYSVRSNRLANALIARGMIKEKGPNRTPTAELEDNPAFWAGAIDGDGSISNSIYEGKYLYANFSLCGHMPLLEKFRSFLIRRNIADLRIVPTESGIFTIGSSASTAIETIRLLYTKESEPAGLDRKVARAKQILNGEQVKLYKEQPKYTYEDYM